MNGNGGGDETDIGGMIICSPPPLRDTTENSSGSVSSKRDS